MSVNVICRATIRTSAVGSTPAQAVNALVAKVESEVNPLGKINLEQKDEPVATEQLYTDSGIRYTLSKIGLCKMLMDVYTTYRDKPSLTESKDFVEEYIKKHGKPC